MDHVQQEADRIYKQHFGKMVACLLYSSHDIDPETAEDIVQDSFSAALENWQKQGIPSNPAGWIYRVCRNKALNKLKKNKRTEPLNESMQPASVEMRFSESVLDDHQLTLLFACAHPDLAPKVQVVITLKYVLNLKVEAIARVFGMSVDGIDKLLVRARQKIRDEKIILEEPGRESLKQRLPIVHKIIYLTFNEGYKSSGGADVVREELCEEALTLMKTVMDNGLGNQDSMAIYSLMLFNSARLKSRFSECGELLDLENQDRSLWNQDLMNLGYHFLQKSKGELVSAYQLEAAIASLHCAARSYEQTDWKTIAGLYLRLVQNQSNPFVTLNYAIALYFAGEKDKSFKILEDLKDHSLLHQYYLLNMTLGKFHHLEGNDSMARQYLQKAFEQTNSPKEKDFISRMIEKLD